MIEQPGNDSGLPLGFKWGAVRAGIKASGNVDLACALAVDGTHASAMFTRNLVVAAPLVVGKRHLAATGGRVRAVVANAGNANCCTGEPGLQAAVDTCRFAAGAFGLIFDEVIPSSTGIIGVPFPIAKVEAAMPSLVAAMGSTAAHAELFATAIMTTDTRRKIARATVDVDGKAVRLFGVAKGAGMIHPQLGPAAEPAPLHATMLVYLFTDLAAGAGQLDAMLHTAVEASFNSISIDGDTSTNDTVLLMASGASGVALAEGRVSDAFESALKLVCQSLAHQIIDDGEGVTHVVTLDVRGAETSEEARQVAKAIAHSPLNKTAWSSADPNWGRLLAAIGSSGVLFDPANASVWIGEHLVFDRGGVASGFSREVAHEVMLKREFTITIELGEGSESCRFLTCDLTKEYVAINADYTT